MVTIKIKSTGEKKVVTKNVAFDLIDRGLATKVSETNDYEQTKEQEITKPSPSSMYNTRKMSARKTS